MRRATKATLVTPLILVALMACGANVRAADDGQSPGDEQPVKKIRVTIYPLLVKAPIFGATITLPSLPPGPSSPPGGGGEGGALSEATDSSLNAAYMAGFLIEADRWFLEATGTYAAVTASRSAPRVNVDSNTYFYGARGGVRLAGDFSATAGVRRITTGLDATLSLPNSNTTIEGHSKPGVWDPLIGVDWRRDMGQWTVDGNLQGGGWGVGSDADVSAEVHARVRVLNHVEVRAGYSIIYFKLTVANVSIGSFQRTLVAEQSLHGPEIGVGIVF